MLGTGKNMGILLLSITVILSAATFLTTQNLDKSSSSDVALVMGHMTLTVTDENGYVKHYRQTDNVIVDVGWNNLIENSFTGIYNPGSGKLNGTGASAFSHIAIGSVGTGLATTNDALEFELTGCPRTPLEIDGTSADIDTGKSSIAFTLFAGFGNEIVSGCTGTDISEAGVFNGTSGANTVMFARNVFTTVPALGSFDFLEIAWDFTFSGNTVS